LFRSDVDFLRAIAGQVAGFLERSELQRRLELQLAEIRISHDIHERFTRLSLDGAGIPAILDAVSVLAGGRAALYSPDGFRIRGAGESAEGMPPRLHLPTARLTPGARQSRVRQAERLGHRLPSRAWVVVMEPDDARSESEMAARGLRDRLDSALADLVRGRAPGGLTLVRSASAVIIAPEEAVADLQAAEA